MMGRARIDLTGQVFSRLTVVEYSHRKHATYWKCRCHCGNTCTVQAQNLKSGHSTSCGCYQRESVRARATTHGMHITPEYIVWGGMHQRCGNERHRQHTSYGGRGISVCSEWSSFEQFYKDMGPRPSKGHSLDRIDNDGPYCKENCRWATTQVQTNNRRVNKFLSLDGIVLTVSQWSQRLGVPRSTLQGRLERGWSVSDALSMPVMRKYANDPAR